MKIKWSASLFRVNWFHVWPFPICNILENNFSTRSILKKKKLLVHFAKRWCRIGLDQTMLIYSLLIRYIKALFWLFSHYLFIAKSGELFNKKNWKHVKACDRIGLIKFYWNCFVWIFFDKQKNSRSYISHGFCFTQSIIIQTFGNFSHFWSILHIFSRPFLLAVFANRCANLLRDLCKQ